jgi:hypothetical protein
VSAESPAAPPKVSADEAAHQVARGGLALRFDASCCKSVRGSNGSIDAALQGVWFDAAVQRGARYEALCADWRRCQAFPRARPQHEPRVRRAGLVGPTPGYFMRIWHGVPMGERCSQSWRRCGQGQSAVPARTREPCACGCQRLFFPAVANLLGKLRSKLVWRSMVSAATKAREAHNCRLPCTISRAAWPPRSYHVEHTQSLQFRHNDLI